METCSILLDLYRIIMECLGGAQLPLKKHERMVYLYVRQKGRPAENGPHDGYITEWRFRNDSKENGKICRGQFCHQSDV